MFRAPPPSHFQHPKENKSIHMTITDENKINVTGINFSPLRYKIHIEI